MAKSKKQADAAKAFDPEQLYTPSEALELVQKLATAKFDESIDVAVNLGIDSKKSDQVVRGSVVLPAGPGRTVRVAVFTQGDKIQAAKAAPNTPKGVPPPALPSGSRKPQPGSLQKEIGCHLSGVIDQDLVGRGRISTQVFRSQQNSDLGVVLCQAIDDDW